MITEDFELVKEIFAIIDEGIVDGYDAFSFEVEVGEGYMDMNLKVDRDGVEIPNARTNINDAILYGLVKKLKESAGGRGEHWISFVMSYRLGDQVRTNFRYAKG
ncbi:hypothetical protein [Chitinimonas naiadis]